MQINIIVRRDFKIAAKCACIGGNSVDGFIENLRRKKKVLVLGNSFYEMST